jgi:DNA repair exonuclease SbcCD ATPase subunit
MPVYGKSTTGQGTVVPDIKEVEIMSIDDALKALEPSLRAFTALASIYKIVTLAKDLEKLIITLNKDKDNISKDINNLKNIREVLKDNQAVELADLKNKHTASIKTLHNEHDQVVSELNKLKAEQEKLHSEITMERTTALNSIKIECSEMLSAAEAKVKDLNTKAILAEAKLNKAINDYNTIKAKFT